ncbi:uncharacterized protein LOC131250654 [Magnolia sinica]|uniref:uncharacterized protein LOC131250654 n=1 Tax=Magnolia sinica TaxID=86752 RepID=UPI00265AF643|nr:uncharacterized protein LOC131250654 [Magnolia sinica]
MHLKEEEETNSMVNRETSMEVIMIPLLCHVQFAKEQIMLIRIVGIRTKMEISHNAFNAKNIRHIEKNCHQKAREQANFHEEKEDAKDETEDKLFLSCLAKMNDEVWYLDSGCSNHMTGNKNYFVEIDESVKPQVTMGDNNQVKVHGIGTIVVATR